MPPAERGAAAALLRRERWAVVAGLTLLTALAAVESVWIGGAMMHSGSRLFVPHWGTWGGRELLVVALMWSVMMIAMMVPSTAPMVLTFSHLERQRRERAPRPKAAGTARTGAFLGGYLAVWVGFSLLATGAQWGLRSAALLAHDMRLASAWLGGLLLLGAGLYQFSAAKSACLHHCRSPVGFLLGEWREGMGGAFVMGLRHGAYCTGCCWLLMSLLFVAGVMNAAWCAALAALVLAERVVPGGLWLARLAGVGLGGWGTALLALAF